MARIEEAEDVEHEKSKEQRKQEEKEEFGEKKTMGKHDLEERIEHEMTHLPFRSRRGHCIEGWARGGLSKAIDAEIWVMVRRKRRRNVGNVWIYRRLMAWLREIGLEFVDIIVKSDNEPALASLIESWSTLTGMKNGSRMIIENSLVGSSKSNEVVE